MAGSSFYIFTLAVPSPDCSSWKPPSGTSLPASYYQCVSFWKGQGEMNIVHAGCSTESLLKQIRQILAGEGRDLSIFHVEQLEDQGSHLRQSAPVSCRAKELVATRFAQSLESTSTIVVQEALINLCFPSCIKSIPCFSRPW